ncbi:MAG: hypothetical protein K2N87_10105 [Eubacterium sp.]|nr:hypothetical protein [Eubacterium sp.]
MKIRSSVKGYNLEIHQDFESIKSQVYDTHTFAIIDRRLYEIYRQELFQRMPAGKIYLMEALEKNKTIETVLEICEEMTKLSAKRNIKLLAFGGGIVQDVAGFVANILYRGIYWAFFPSTLLAACDSCIGGKTSLNYKKFKNLLGTFYPPDEIHICVPFFQTLSEKDYLSGLGEVAKFQLMAGRSGIDKLEKNIDVLLAKEAGILMEFIEDSLELKKALVEADEFDRGIRIHLNFAHTFGHAFETVSGYCIPHGTAVAMGMVVANRISLDRGWLEEELVNRVEEILRKLIHIALEDAWEGVEIDMDSLVQVIHKDKKQTGKALTVVLMRDDMETVGVYDVTRNEIERAITYLIQWL